MLKQRPFGRTAVAQDDGLVQFDFEFGAICPARGTLEVQIGYHGSAFTVIGRERTRTGSRAVSPHWLNDELLPRLLWIFEAGVGRNLRGFSI